jgi:arginyl-tRNA synthetase
MIVERLKNLLREAIDGLFREGKLSEAGFTLEIELERPARPEHGDFSSNIALSLARSEGKPPREIAESIVRGIPRVPEISDIQIAGAGFINFYLSQGWLHEALARVAREGDSYGRSDVGKGIRVQVEYGSPNPTGPIHVGNARNIVYGDALASLLQHAGFTVDRENYVNDSGRQIQQFARSLEIRYRQALGQEVDMPEDGYHGDYLIDLGRLLAKQEGMGLIGQFDEIAKWGIEQILEQQRETLKRLGVSYDNWVRQSALEHSGEVEMALSRLRAANAIYEHRKTKL